MSLVKNYFSKLTSKIILTSGQNFGMLVGQHKKNLGVILNTSNKIVIIITTSFIICKNIKGKVTGQAIPMEGIQRAIAGDDNLFHFAYCSMLHFPFLMKKLRSGKYEKSSLLTELLSTILKVWYIGIANQNSVLSVLLFFDQSEKPEIQQVIVSGPPLQ